MAQIRKYAFTTEFSPDGAIVRAAPPPLTAAEIDAKCDIAYENGKADALAEAERRSAAALEALATTASAVLKQLGAEARAMREEAAHVALSAARKIAGAALDGFGHDRAAAAIEAAMDALRHHPRLLVKLSADAAEILRPRIEEMREAHAYAGAVLVRAETNVGAGEVSIDWSDGIIHLNAEDAAQRISALIDAALAAP